MNDPIQLIKQITEASGEEWKPVKGFETRFWISNRGFLVSHDHRKNTVRFLSPHLDSLGYYAATLRSKPDKRKVRVHTLVAEHFLQKPESNVRITVNHKDGNKQNNHVDNLEWITAADNVRHAVAIGLFNIKGSKHHNSKLTESDVIQIRQMRKDGLIHKAIAAQFGVSREQIRDICNYKMWLHVP